MATDLTKNPELATQFFSAGWALGGLRLSIVRMQKEEDSHSVVEAAFWIEAAAEALQEDDDPENLLGAFRFVRNLGAHMTMHMMQGMMPNIEALSLGGPAPLEWVDVSQWVSKHEHKKPRYKAYNRHLRGKEILSTLEAAERLLIGLRDETISTMPKGSSWRIDAKEGSLTLSIKPADD